MSRLTFVITAYAAVSIQAGLAPLWGVPHGGSQATPSLLLILTCFLALMAPSLTAVWSAVILGLLADALSAVPLVGPHALGFALGAYVVLQLRGLVFRESVLTLAFMTLAAGVFAHLGAVALIAIRSIPLTPGGAVEGFVAADELVGRFFDVLYTAAASVPVGWLLFRTASWWGFPAKRM